MVVKGRPTHSRWLQQSMIRGSMLGKTLLAGDEELGKKDDDHRYAPARRPHRPLWNHTLRWRRKRLLVAIVGLAIVFMFLWTTRVDIDDPDDRQRYPLGRPVIPAAYDKYEDEPAGPPPGIQRPTRGNPPLHTYDGSINFFRLAKTLRRQASQTSGYDKRNRNVLFAASSVASAARLLPLICGMASVSRNYVHAAFMGRDDIPLEDLLEINGIDRDKCPAIWHDARPDYCEYSSDARLEDTAVGALSHINTFLHPQVAIIDDASSEDAAFVRGVRTATQSQGKPLIEVPKGRAEDFGWITRLDSGSLSNWYTPVVDILVQVPPGSSSVLRLLKSIKDADYTGMKPPRITLELPADLDDTVKENLENFKWPLHDDNPTASSGLTIRRRIAKHGATQEESAIRFLELFYPANTRKSHVLLLSAQAQLSPQYFHFVKYALLEYKYSLFDQHDSKMLMGLSLAVPSVLLDGKTKLTAPTINDMNSDKFIQSHPATESVPFLWQAPNSHAAIFFGDKWAELHSFLGNRVLKHQQSPTPKSRAKLVSETLPSWTEYVLEFMRARSYSLFYPATIANALVTVHNELYHVPEEFVAPPLKRAEPLAAGTSEEAFLRAEQPPPAPKNAEPPVIPRSQPLYQALPFDGELPETESLPQLLYDGTLIDPANVSDIALDYANTFREEVGGCTIPKGKHRKVITGKTSDLFCFGDEDKNDWEEDELPEIESVGAQVGSADAALVMSVPASSAVTSTAQDKITAGPIIEADDF